MDNFDPLFLALLIACATLLGALGHHIVAGRAEKQRDELGGPTFAAAVLASVTAFYLAISGLQVSSTSDLTNAWVLRNWSAP